MLVLLCALGVGAAAPAAAGRDARILGVWLTENGRARVEISHEGTFVGRIVWLKDAVYAPDDPEGMAGRPIVDRFHPDPSLRSRPVLGLEILWGFEYVGDDGWKGGRVYDPESGRTYKARLRLADPDRLELRGYVGIPWFGRTSAWRRVDAPAEGVRASEPAGGPAR